MLPVFLLAIWTGLLFAAYCLALPPFQRVYELGIRLDQADEKYLNIGRIHPFVKLLFAARWVALAVVEFTMLAHSLLGYGVLRPLVLLVLLAVVLTVAFSLSCVSMLDSRYTCLSKMLPALLVLAALEVTLFSEVWWMILSSLAVFLMQIRQWLKRRGWVKEDSQVAWSQLCWLSFVGSFLFFDDNHLMIRPNPSGGAALYVISSALVLMGLHSASSLPSEGFTQRQTEIFRLSYRDAICVNTQ